MKKTAFVILFLFAGCSDDFSPNGEYQKRLIVYAVIDGSSSTQMVRVYSTFSPDAYDPLLPSPNSDVANASVNIVDGNVSYIFHDTLITVSNGSGATKQVRAYVNYVLQPIENKTYVLTVFAPGYDTVKSAISGVFPGDIIPGNISLFSKPATEKYIPIRVSLGSNAKAYLAMISLEYEIPNDSVLKVKEVPVIVKKNESGEVIQRFYPKITFRDASSVLSTSYETITFESAAYTSVISDIKKEYQGITVKFRRAILTLIQFDNGLYTYYSITNAFGGGSTIRLDEPDYTNIVNGFGVFGMMTKQERSYGLPSDL